ncbi:MAG: VOC family protein [Actinomycetota bacterium]
MAADHPKIVATVLDATDARELAEFYRRLLGFEYARGDESPPPGEPDERGTSWLVLCDEAGTARLAVQQVDELPAATWPAADVPQQLHLDLSVPSREALDEQHERALALGARLLEDRADDPVESIRIYADPAGHPFCLIVLPHLG